MSISSDTTFLIIVIGLVVLQLFSDYFIIWKKVTTGKSLVLNDEDNDYSWGGSNLAFCILGAIILIPFLEFLLEPEHRGLAVIMTLFLGFIIYVINGITMLCLLDSIFSSKTRYLQDCAVFGFDIKGHVGKFVITCRKNERYSRENGNTKVYTVSIKRIETVLTALGVFAKVTHIEEIIDLLPHEVSKSSVQRLAKDYFKNRKDLRLTYLVESETDCTPNLLLKEESSFEVLTINMED